MTSRRAVWVLVGVAALCAVACGGKTTSAGAGGTGAVAATGATGGGGSVDARCRTDADCDSGFCAGDTCSDVCRSVCVDDNRNMVGVPVCRMFSGGGSSTSCEPFAGSVCTCPPSLPGGVCVHDGGCDDTLCGDGDCRPVENPENCPEDCG